MSPTNRQEFETEPAATHENFFSGCGGKVTFLTAKVNQNQGNTDGLQSDLDSLLSPFQLGGSFISRSFVTHIQIYYCLLLVVYVVFCTVIHPIERTVNSGMPFPFPYTGSAWAVSLPPPSNIFVPKKRHQIFRLTVQHNPTSIVL